MTLSWLTISDSGSGQLFASPGSFCRYDARLPRHHPLPVCVRTRMGLAVWSSWVAETAEFCVICFKWIETRRRRVGVIVRAMGTSVLVSHVCCWVE
jgi:hypothetical protein